MAGGIVLLWDFILENTLHWTKPLSLEQQMANAECPETPCLLWSLPSGKNRTIEYVSQIMAVLALNDCLLALTIPFRICRRRRRVDPSRDPVCDECGVLLITSFSPFRCSQFRPCLSIERRQISHLRTPDHLPMHFSRSEATPCGYKLKGS